MRTKGKEVYLLLLVALVLLSASCVGTDTTKGPNQVGSASDTTSSTRLPVTSIVTHPDTSSITSTVIDGSYSTTVVTSTTATPNRELSQAWIDSQVVVSKSESDDFEDRNYYIEYLSINPNKISTPMGALCWAYHELERSYFMDSLRFTLDYYTIPFFMENYGITDEQIGDPGPEATGKFFDLVLSDLGSLGPVDDEDDVITEANTIGYFIDLHEFAGDGTAWPDAVRIITSPEMAAALQAGEGLPAEVPNICRCSGCLC